MWSVADFPEVYAAPFSMTHWMPLPEPPEAPDVAVKSYSPDISILGAPIVPDAGHPSIRKP